MKKYARIESGIVVELLSTDGDIATMFHPDLHWVECSQQVKVGHTYDGSSFHAPVVVLPSLAEQKARRVATLESQMAAIEGVYSRPLRDLVPATHQAHEKMLQIEAEVAPLRTLRAAILAATTQEQLDSV